MSVPAALDEAYGDLADLALGLDEERSWAPTRCPGWTARDLVHHLLGDAQRILVALATPADRPADVDAVSYWQSAPGAPDALSAGIRAERALATAVTEAAIHHLDLLVTPGPRAGPLAVARRTLDGLLGRPTPVSWPDAEWVLTATGRARASPEVARTLGDDAGRLPLLR